MSTPKRVRFLRKGEVLCQFRGWSAALVAWVRLVIVRLPLVSVLSLDFHGRLRVVRTTLVPEALHGIEAYLLAQSRLLKLRAAVLTATWSRRQPLAHAGAVLCLFDGTEVCNPRLCAMRLRFRMLRRYLAYRSQEVGWIYRMLALADEGCLDTDRFICSLLVLLV